jgi:hypothetical protein
MQILSLEISKTPVLDDSDGFGVDNVRFVVKARDGRDIVSGECFCRSEEKEKVSAKEKDSRERETFSHQHINP